MCSPRPLPLRRLRHGITLVLCVGLFTGCATTGVNRGDVNLVSLEEEWQLGRQLEADIARQMTLVNDRTALAYINDIGQRIVRQTDMANLPWEFHIVADPAINAFNIPGGHVYVNTGLIAAVDNVAELAAVMGHEIVHGVARHGTERLTKAYGLNIGAGLLLGQNPAVYEQLLAQVVGGGALAKFSRNDEREADQLGIRYMYRAGYNPAAMATIFEKILGQQRRRPSSVEKFFSTHPLTQERVSEARRRARQLSGKRGLVTHDGQLSSIQRRLSRYNR